MGKGAWIALVLVLATAGAAKAQYLSTTSSVALNAGDAQGEVWRATWSETYSPPFVVARVRALALAGLVYASDHTNERFPDAASLLFIEGYETSPATFYSHGDLDDAPTAIDNDAPNAPNSAQISFDYVGAGRHLWDPPDTILFMDNSTTNHAGLGRALAYLDGHGEFVPVWPHPFTDLRVLLTERSSCSIWRRASGTYVPYAFALAPDGAAEALVAPHHLHLTAEGSLTQAWLGVFAAEGFGASWNRSGTSSGSSLLLGSAQLNGPAGAAQPVTVYVHFSATLVRESSDVLDSASFQATLVWSGGQTSQDYGTVFHTRFGMAVFPKAVVLEQRALQPGDAGYVPGAQAMFVRGIMQLTVHVPVAVAGTLHIRGTALTSLPVTAQSMPGNFLRAVVDADLPVMPALDQIKLYCPSGYTLTVPDTYGPGDMVVAVLRGDDNLDGQIDGADRTAFEAAYTRPLVSVNHVAGSFGALQTFDFDGAGDVDCVDYAAFKLAWTGGGTPAFFAPCDLDADGDTVSDGDDDCPATEPGIIVDERGCPVGDFDGDADIDLSDWAHFGDCMAGPNTPPRPTPPTLPSQCLNAFDRNGDADVDLGDAAGLQQRYPES